MALELLKLLESPRSLTPDFLDVLLIEFSKLLDTSSFLKDKNLILKDGNGFTFDTKLTFSKLKKLGPDHLNLAMRILRLAGNGLQEMNEMADQNTIDLLAQTIAISLRAVYSLEPFSPTKPLMLEKFASGLICKLVQVKKFQEALVEINRLFNKLASQTTSDNKNEQKKKVRLNPTCQSELGQGWDKLVIKMCYQQFSSTNGSEILKMILILQNNIIRCCYEIGDQPGLEALSELKINQPGSPFSLCQQLKSSDALTGDQHMHIFYQGFRLCSHKLEELGGNVDHIMSLNKLSLDHYLESTKFDLMKGVNLVTTFVKYYERNEPNFANSPVITQSMLHSIVTKLERMDSIKHVDNLDYMLFHYLAIVKEKDPREALECYQRVSTIVSKVLDEHDKEYYKVTVPWLISMSFIGKVSPFLIDRAVGSEFFILYFNRSEELISFLSSNHMGYSLADRFSKALSWIKKSWWHFLQKPVSIKAIDHPDLVKVLISFSTIMKGALASLSKNNPTFNGNRTNVRSSSALVKPIVELLGLFDSPLLAIDADSYLELIRHICALLNESHSIDTWLALSSRVFNGGSTLYASRNHIQAQAFFEISCALHTSVLGRVKGNPKEAQIAEQMAMRHKMLGSCLEFQAKSDQASDSQIHAINASPDVNLTSTHLDNVISDSNSTRLTLIDYYVNLYQGSNRDIPYQPISTHPILKEQTNIQLAIIIERELHNLAKVYNPRTEKPFMTLADQLCDIYGSDFPLRNGRIMLLKADFLFSKLVYLRISSVKKGVDEFVTLEQIKVEEGNIKKDISITFLKIDRLFNCENLAQDQNIEAMVPLLRAKLAFGCGLLGHEFKELDISHFSEGLRHWESFYFSLPPLKDNIKPTINPSLRILFGDLNMTFEYGKWLLGLFEMLRLNQLSFRMCDILVRLCAGRTDSKRFVDGLEVYIRKSILAKSQDDFETAFDIIRSVEPLCKLGSNLMVSGLLWRLAASELLILRGQLPKARDILTKLSGLGDKLKSLESLTRTNLIIDGLHCYSQLYMAEGDVASAQQYISQHYKLTNRSLYSSIVRKGIKAVSFAGMSPDELIRCCARSSSYFELNRLINAYRYVFEVLIANGMLSEAERNICTAIKIAEYASAYAQLISLKTQLSEFQLKRNRITSYQTTMTSFPQIPPCSIEKEWITRQLYSTTILSAKAKFIKKGPSAAVEEFDNSRIIIRGMKGGKDEDTLRVINLPTSPVSGELEVKINGLLVQANGLLALAQAKDGKLEPSQRTLAMVKLVDVSNQILIDFKIDQIKVNLLSLLASSFPSKLQTLTDSFWSAPAAMIAKVIDFSMIDFIPEHLSNNERKELQALVKSKLDSLEPTIRSLYQKVILIGQPNQLYELAGCFATVMFLSRYFTTKLHHLSLNGDGSQTLAAFFLEIPKSLTARRQMVQLLKEKIGQKVNNEPQWPIYPKKRMMNNNNAESSIHHDLLLAYEKEFKLKPDEYFKSILPLIPDNWVVCSISFNSLTEDLYITRYQNNGYEPILIRIPTLSKYKSEDNPTLSSALSFSETLIKLNKIISDAVNLVRNSPNCDTKEKRTEWWNKRYLFDTQIGTLLKYLEGNWFGAINGIFEPNLTPLSNHIIINLKESIEDLFKNVYPQLKGIVLDINLDLLKIMLAQGNKIKPFIVQDMLFLLIESAGMCLSDQLPLDEDTLKILSKEFLKLWNNAFSTSSILEEPINSSLSNHLILILDKHTHAIPWESLPFLKSRAICRLPCLSFLRDRILSMNHPTNQIKCNNKFDQRGHYVNPENAYFILNPTKDLYTTQLTFQDKLKGYTNWSGLIEQMPTYQQASTAMETKDIYLFMGHGHGQQFLVSSKVKKLKSNAVALLFGCSSGQLNLEGEFDPNGALMSYLQAGCPAVLCNLWDVTDRDLDRICLKTLNQWQLGPFNQELSKDSLSLDQALAISRNSASLKYLTGCAPVVYGIPTYLMRDNQQHYFNNMN